MGQTNIIFFDTAGQQIAAYDIAVKRDLNGVRAALKTSLPNSDIQIDGVNDGVVLSGAAASPIKPNRLSIWPPASRAAPTRSSIRSPSAAATR